MKAANRAGAMLLDEVAPRRAGEPTPAAYRELGVCMPPSWEIVTRTRPARLKVSAYDPCPNCGWFHAYPPLPF